MSLFRWIAGIVVFLALLVLSLENSEPVTIRIYRDLAWQTPLIFLLLVIFVAGVVAGLLAGLLRSTRLKRQIARLRREHGRRGADVNPRHGDVA
jgi:putative membrane protein